jgi:hypothetical protein
MTFTFLVLGSLRQNASLTIDMLRLFRSSSPTVVTVPLAGNVLGQPVVPAYSQSHFNILFSNLGKINELSRGRESKIQQGLQISMQERPLASSILP